MLTSGTASDISAFTKREPVESRPIVGDLYAILQREAPVAPLPIGNETRPALGTAYTKAAEKPAPKEPLSWLDIAKELGPIEWDWPGWLAKGFLCILAALSGIGKSILALRIAACYIMGWCWPDGSAFTGKKGKVLWCECEHAEALNLERAMKWGLPLESILTPNVDDPLAGVDLDNPQHRAAIAQIAKREDVRLIIVDSLSAASASRDENSSAMLKITRWLAALAKEVQKPVLVTHHLRKAGMGDPQGPTLERLRGHSSIVQCSRIVWSLHKPDTEKAALRLSVIKSNLAKFPQAVGMAIDDEGKVSFGAAPMKARELSEIEKAAAFLKKALAQGPMKSELIYSAAEAVGIRRRTLERAKGNMPIKSHKVGNDWLWTLRKEDNGELGELGGVGELGELEFKSAKSANIANDSSPPNGGDDPYGEGSLFDVGPGPE